MKKVWQKPILLVLTRSKPEESVLNACKSSTTWTSPQTTVGYCTQVPNMAHIPCDGCNTVAAS